MACKKNECYKPKPMTKGKWNIIQGLLQEYNIEPTADIQKHGKTFRTEPLRK